MDEAGFRIGIPGGQKVIVPRNVTEMYTPSPENRLSITIIESVCSTGATIAPVPRQHAYGNLVPRKS